MSTRGILFSSLLTPKAFLLEFIHICFAHADGQHIYMYYNYDDIIIEFKARTAEKYQLNIYIYPVLVEIVVCFCLILPTVLLDCIYQIHVSRHNFYVCIFADITRARLHTQRM